jgi:hypothetical protein
MFVDGVSAIAADAETIEHRNAHRGEKVSVRRAADLRFTEFEVETSAAIARAFSNSSTTAVVRSIGGRLMPPETKLSFVHQSV